MYEQDSAPVIAQQAEIAQGAKLVDTCFEYIDYNNLPDNVVFDYMAGGYLVFTSGTPAEAYRGTQSTLNQLELDYYNVRGHETLNILGMIPGIGAAADLVNAVWYAAEGNYLAAGFSAVSSLFEIDGIAKVMNGVAKVTGIEWLFNRFYNGCTKLDDMIFGFFRGLGKSSGSIPTGMVDDIAPEAAEEVGRAARNSDAPQNSGASQNGGADRVKTGSELINNIRKVEYSTDELSMAAIQYRNANNITSAQRNVCVVEYQTADGSLVQQAFVSNASNHSEEVMIDYLTANNISGEDVKRIFTERAPCVETATNVGHNCTDRIIEYSPDAEVTYAVDYGVTREDGKMREIPCKNCCKIY